MLLEIEWKTLTEYAKHKEYDGRDIAHGNKKSIVLREETLISNHGPWAWWRARWTNPAQNNTSDKFKVSDHSNQCRCIWWTREGNATTAYDDNAGATMERWKPRLIDVKDSRNGIAETTEKCHAHSHIDTHTHARARTDLIGATTKHNSNGWIARFQSQHCYEWNGLKINSHICFTTPPQLPSLTYKLCMNWVNNYGQKRLENGLLSVGHMHVVLNLFQSITYPIRAHSTVFDSKAIDSF